MADLVNLRLHRKRKVLRQQEEQAAANRARFGRSKEQRRADEIEAARADRRLDGHRLAPNGKDGDAS